MTDAHRATDLGVCPWIALTVAMAAFVALGIVLVMLLWRLT